MARKARQDLDSGVWHHVMNRGARKQAIYRFDYDREMFLSLLARAVSRTDVEAHAYALMGNHFHLLFHGPTSAMSEAMHLLCGSYTQRFNKRYGFDGPLFRERFKSVPVTSEEQLLWTSRYIHLNPAEINSRHALDSYRWSSYPAYVGRIRAPCWLDTTFVLSMFGDDPSRYREFVETPASQVEPVSRSDEGPRPRRASSSKDTVSIDDVERTVASITSVKVADIHRMARRKPNLARSIAMAMAVETNTLTAAEVARRYGLANPSGVRAAIGRLGARERSDASVAAAMRRVRVSLGDAEAST